MVNRKIFTNISRRLNRSDQNVLNAAAIISFSYILSRLLALLRDRLLIANFGFGDVLDTYSAAFRIPDFIFNLLVSGALAAAFIPLYVELISKHQDQKANEVTSSILTTLGLLIGIATLACFIFAPNLVALTSGGFSAEKQQQVVYLTRIMLVTPLLFTIGAVLGSIQQSHNRFLLFALNGVFYNLGIIFGILYLANLFPNNPIDGVAYGVVLGTVIQVLVQLFGIRGLGIRLRFKIDLKMKEVRNFFTLLIPRSLDLGIDQVNYLIESAIASHLQSASMIIYNTANNIKNVPVGLIGGAIGTAIFPGLIRSIKSHDPETISRTVENNWKLIIMLMLPITAIFIVLRGYFVRILVGDGNVILSNTIALLAGSILAQSLFIFIARIYYAFGDTKTPLFISLASIIINIILSLLLTKSFGREFGIYGLGIALSIAGIFELVVAVFILLKYRLPRVHYKQLLIFHLKIITATIFSAILTYLIMYFWLPLRISDVGFLSLTSKSLFLLGTGLFSFIKFSHMLKIKEIDEVVALIKNKFSPLIKLLPRL